MVESSKILTVSYGTFSCTLEGFDDSFGTMKAIAEYFRDLAAGDRYFGAEPPIPDAEMLTRIAEREIERRVDARSDESGIVLRASPALAVAAAELDVADADAPVATEQHVDATPVAAPDATMPPVTRPSAETTAALDSAKRHGNSAAAQDAAPQMPADTAFSDDADIVDDTAQSDRDAEDDAFAAMMPPVSQPPAHPDPESVAAKLQRIRAVVGRPVAPEDTEMADNLASPLPALATGDFEQEFAEDDSITPDMSAADHAMTAADVPDMATPDAAIDHAEDTYQDEDTDEETPVSWSAETPEDVITPDAVAEDLSEAASDTAATDVAAYSEDVDNTDQQISDVLLNLERAGAAAATASTNTVTGATDDVTVPAAAPAADTAYADAEDTANTDDATSSIANVMAAARQEPPLEEEDAPRRPTLRARILRVAKQNTAAASTATPDAAPAVAAAAELSGMEQLSDMDDAEAMIPAEETAQAPLDDAIDFAELDGVADLSVDDTIAETGLSAEDEAALQAELQHVASEAEADRIAARAGRNILPENDDAAMSRIMTQTDEELSDPDNSRRRAAIAQLKAAVAATEAARQLGETGGTTASAEEPFRDDLKQAVQPRRAERPTNRSERPERGRPAPLKLVASQRIDPAEQPAPDGPAVQPRRVAAAETPQQSDASSFAEFAEDMGAKDLPDLLEAAAAYTAFVEGIEDFSRPQIMKKVQATTDQAFSREDGLRSFGTLLRQGRISKIRNGRFQVSEQTRFKPEQQAG